MAPKKDTLQDDYYANISSSAPVVQPKVTEDKKPIKIKKKPVIKNTDKKEEKIEIEKPKKSNDKKIEKTTEKVVVSSNQKNSKQKNEKNPSKPEKQEKKARLVEREHASQDLLRSVMSKNSVSQSEKTETVRPVISFNNSISTFKPLENRPVMKTPEEERREAQKAKRKAEREERRKNFKNKNSQNSSNQNGQNSQNNGQKNSQNN